MFDPEMISCAQTGIFPAMFDDQYLMVSKGSGLIQIGR